MSMTTPAELPNLEFKLARLGDAHQIARMSRELVESGLPWSWQPTRVAASIRGRDSNVLTAWIDSQLAGFAIMQFSAEHAHLNLLAVNHAYRNVGIGRRLIEWLEETARVGGIFFINLEVRAGNMGARAFYRKLGYQETSYIPGYYSGREDAIRMTHDLRRAYPANTP